MHHLANEGKYPAFAHNNSLLSAFRDFGFRRKSLIIVFCSSVSAIGCPKEMCVFRKRPQHALRTTSPYNRFKNLPCHPIILSDKQKSQDIQKPITKRSPDLFRDGTYRGTLFARDESYFSESRTFWTSSSESTARTRTLRNSTGSL